MSSTREEEQLFVVKSKGKTFNYYLGYDKTEAANVNYELIEKADQEATTTGSIITSKNLPSHLQEGVSITVIDSVLSGTGRDKRKLYQTVIKPIFDQLGVNHSLLKTTSSESITDFAKSLDLTKQQTIILLSGDTSAIELINGLPKTRQQGSNDINLSLVPLGTGNALVSSVGIFSEVDGLKNIFNGKKSPLPLYEVEFPKGSYATHLGDRPVDKLFFTIVVSWGSHAQLVYKAEAPELKLLGVERFKIAAGQVFQGKMDYDCDMIVVEDSKERKITDSSIHKYSSILAAPRLEKNYVISPESELKKSELHVLEFGDIPLPEFIGLLHAPYEGRAHVDHEKVIYESITPGKEIILRLHEDDDERAILCVDGICVKVKNPNGKEVKVRFVDEKELDYKVNLIGL